MLLYGDNAAMTGACPVVPLYGDTGTVPYN